MKKVLIYIGRILFVIVFGTLLTGIVIEQSARYRANMQYKPPGDLIDIGDHQLHYLKQGTGGPTVVFESGLGNDHSTWDLVQPEIAKSTTTLSYDRAGLLWSERGNNPKTGLAMGEELEALLAELDLPKPYILVGHSIAGCTLRPFIKNNQKDLAAVIFVDTSHPEQLEKGSSELREKMSQGVPPAWLIQFLDGFGFLRFIMRNDKMFPDLDKKDPKNKMGRANFFRSVDGLVDEAGVISNLLEEAKPYTDLGAIPFTIISASDPEAASEMLPENLVPEFNQLWDKLQNDQLMLFENGNRIKAMESGHMVQLQQPQLVIEAIKTYLE